jgi:NitT/TauT family transport system ATP-binding protein
VNEPTPLTVGFIPLLDCALLVAAAENGFAGAEGLELRLVRENSWANIRDRVAIGQFDAAHMLGPMVVAGTLGASPLDVPLLTPVALAGAAMGDPPAVVTAALARVVAARAARGDAQLVLAMVFPFSCHNYQLREWLRAGGIDPVRDVRLVVLPPPLLADALRSGQIDGFCAGEPWNSVAVEAGAGVIATVITDIWPGAPEKVVGMREDFALRNPARVRALVRAIEAASNWLKQSQHREELAELLAEPRFVGVPARLLRAAMEGEIRLGPNQAPVRRAGFIDLWSDAATQPLPEHASWFCEQMQCWGQITADSTQQPRAAATFRMDLYKQALQGG